MLLLLSHHYHYITLSDDAAAVVSPLSLHNKHLTVLCNDNGETAAASSDSVM
jgi:hypothetical protein